MSFPVGIRIRRQRPIADVAGVQRSARSTIRRLMADGWTLRAAGNMAAYLAGLTPAATGWTLREINALVFLRWLHQRAIA